MTSAVIPASGPQRRLELTPCGAHDARMLAVESHRRAALAVIVAAVALLTAVLGAVDVCFAQASNAAKAGPVLDDQHLRKILKRLEEAGKARTIPAKVTAALGATKGDETLDVREIAFERAEYQHGFYKSLRAGDDRFILAFRTPDKKWTAFLTNSRLRLAAAVSWNAGETPAPWKSAEADQAFENELAYWAILAETF
jgi:hypothetical protein